MAGDWIAMRCDLVNEPEVIAMADDLGLAEDAVVGKLHRVWSWANRHTVDGNAAGVTFSWINRYLGCDGFAECMERVGWLETCDQSVCFPKFDRFNSQSGKQRLLTSKRVASHKRKGNAKGNGASVTLALPTEQNRTEQNRTSPDRSDERPEVLAIDPIPMGLVQWNDLRHLMKRIAVAVTKRDDVSARHLRDPDYELCARAAALAQYRIGMAWLESVLRSVEQRSKPAESPWGHFRTCLINGAEKCGYDFHAEEVLIDVPKREPTPA